MSRATILNKVRAAQPEALPLPELPSFSLDQLDAIQILRESVSTARAELIEAQSVSAFVRSAFPSETVIVAPDFSDLANHVVADTQNARELPPVDLIVLRAEFIVAENAACWLTDARMGIRVLPFIGEHLVLVVSREAIVVDMHRAYQRIGSNPPGFGVFVAGPSKTADIEQSLVIGAQAARSLKIVLE